MSQWTPPPQLLHSVCTQWLFSAAASTAKLNKLGNALVEILFRFWLSQQCLECVKETGQLLLMLLLLLTLAFLKFPIDSAIEFIWVIA